MQVWKSLKTDVIISSDQEVTKYEIPILSN